MDLYMFALVSGKYVAVTKDLTDYAVFFSE